MDSGQKYLCHPPDEQSLECVHSRERARFALASRQHRKGARLGSSSTGLKKPNNQRMSGGFPHSEIPGSKGALPSPRLIAECHVLHRLLSPRHSPNALHALDPIQWTQDRAEIRRQISDIRQIPVQPAPQRSSVGQPPLSTSDSQPRSVIRLGKTCVSQEPGRPPRLPAHPPIIPNGNIGGWAGRRGGRSAKAQTPKHKSRVSLSSQCQRPQKVQTNRQDPSKTPVGRCPRAKGAQTQGLSDKIHHDRRKWWVEEDLNLRPHAYQACALTT